MHVQVVCVCVLVCNDFILCMALLVSRPRARLVLSLAHLTSSMYGDFLSGLKLTIDSIYVRYNTMYELTGLEPIRDITFMYRNY